MAHRKPALHNAMWPGLVGKGGPDAEPAIDLDTMLDLTAKARVVRLGSQYSTAETFVYDKEGTLVASGRGTYFTAPMK